MRFADALAEVTAPSARLCKVGTIVSELDDDDRQQWDQAIGLGIPGAKLHEALTRVGHQLARSSVHDHLAGRCCCG